ncbi:unnamed protein product [Caenorhabditis auriculariae]|uniref:NF-X1-type domain-containing protein n=1 Tax=Caenorhabditis auriculariae TaxID=2777116 RepID=A0A8S1H8R0_9PELO|nr:unnamed protein product [Caenorhabditis auriculariae]
MPDIGGRIIATQGREFDLDLYRGQRRRPWIEIRFISQERYSTFTNFTLKVIEFLRESGILLDTTSLAHIYNEHEATKEIDEAFVKCGKLYEKGPMSTPVCIFIGGSVLGSHMDIEETFEDFTSSFRGKLYIFTIFEEEAHSMLRDKCFDELKDWCLPQGVATPVPLEPKKAMTFGNVTRDSWAEQSQRSQPRRHFRPRSTRGNPGPSPSPSFSQSKVFILEPPEPRSQDRSSEHPTISTGNATFVDEPMEEGMGSHMVNIDDVNEALKSRTNRPDDDLVIEIAGNYLFERFEHPFQRGKDNVKVLELVDYCCALDHPNARKPKRLLIDQFFQRRFPLRLIYKHFIDEVTEASVQTDICRNLANIFWSSSQLPGEMSREIEITICVFLPYINTLSEQDQLSFARTFLTIRRWFDSEGALHRDIGAAECCNPHFLTRSFGQLTRGNVKVEIGSLVDKFEYLRRGLNSVSWGFDDVGSPPEEDFHSGLIDLNYVTSVISRCIGLFLQFFEGKTAAVGFADWQYFDELVLELPQNVIHRLERTNPRLKDALGRDLDDIREMAQRRDQRDNGNDTPDVHHDFDDQIPSYSGEYRDQRSRRDEEEDFRRNASRTSNHSQPNYEEPIREEYRDNRGRRPDFKDFANGPSTSRSNYDRETNDYRPSSSSSRIEEPRRTNGVSLNQIRQDSHSTIDVEEEPPRPWIRFERTDPPEDFRTLSVIPRLADVMSSEFPYVRRIREDGHYKDSQTYLDVQFRLMREDLLSPLRDHLALYKANGTFRGNRLMDDVSSDLVVLPVSRIEGKEADRPTGTLFRYAFLSVENSPALINSLRYGSWVCLSSDGFHKEVRIAVVVQRDIDDVLMCNRKVGLWFIDEEDDDPVRQNTRYTMVLPNSYLEAYRHVLTALQRTSPYSEIPFERYLIRGARDHQLPAYYRAPLSERLQKEIEKVEAKYNDIRSAEVARRLQADDGFRIKGKKKKKNDDFDSNSAKYFSDLTISMEDDEFEDQMSLPIGLPRHPTEKSLPICIDGKEYEPETLLSDYQPTYMDESQRVAFCKAMTSELAIIQGPPGTGKTHIGVEIAKTMLINRRRWFSAGPILVVCYTNIALDQFLERLLSMIETTPEIDFDPDGPRMIRYGTMCDSDTLKSANVLRLDAAKAHEDRCPIDVRDGINRAHNDHHQRGRDIATSSYILHLLHRRVISYEVMSKAIPVHMKDEFKLWGQTHVDSKNQPLNDDEILACWLTDRSFSLASKNPKTSKYLDMDSDEDDVDFVEVLAPETTANEDGDEERFLNQLFEKMNMDADVQDKAFDLDGAEQSNYRTSSPWDLCDHESLRSCINKVQLFGTGEKFAKTKYSPAMRVDPLLRTLIEDEAPGIFKVSPVTKVEEEIMKNIFSLPRPRRWALYRLWCFELGNKIEENMPRITASYKDSCDRLKVAYSRRDIFLAKKALVVGATTTGAGKFRKEFEKVGFHALIVEEAAEVFESHVFTAMHTSMKHAVLIGDHQQLRPNPSVRNLGVEYGLSISMFERLIEANNLPFSQLQVQHRMTPIIGDVIVRPVFYPAVRDDESVKLYDQVRGMAERLFFWSHSGPSQLTSTMSHICETEIVMITELVGHLLKQGYISSEITVIATYAAQKNALVDALAFLNEDLRPIQIETVDSYQGRENKIVIVSMTRSMSSSGQSQGIGFLGEKNRICVAFTRAKHAMYIVGNGEYLSANSRLMNELVGNLNEKALIDYGIPIKCVTHGFVQVIDSPYDFAKKSPEGGCDQLCGTKLNCGHSCKRPCHPIDDHLQKPCELPCRKTCAVANHQCRKKCSEECGPCPALIVLRMPCGHVNELVCHSASKSVCSSRCDQKLPCGHRCAAKCGERCTQKCEEPVNHVYKLCGHRAEVPCWTVSAGRPPPCEAKCEEELMCGHDCPDKCGEPCQVMCKKLIERTLHCGHIITIECHQENKFVKCEVTFKQKMNPCGHLCLVECGTSDSSEFCTEACSEKLSCGHICGARCGDCRRNGKHICHAKCQKKLPCAHPCVKHCGEKCGDCESYCSTSCLHIKCGAGQMGFGRKCKELCVLCCKPCDNKCAHRSCTKKCYEVCDVKACEEVCQERLTRCQHPCLGMCGEQCPPICGTCDVKEYLKCVSMLGKDATTSIRRLIQLPNCGHIFPVEYLDEHVRKIKESNGPLICPRELCGEYMDKVIRYAKVKKRHVLQLNMDKMLRMKFQPKDLQAAIQNLEKQNSLLKSAQVTKKCPSAVSKGLQEFHSLFLLVILRAHREAVNAINNIGKMDGGRVKFFVDLGLCLATLVDLFIRVSKTTFAKEPPPNFRSVLETAADSQRGLFVKALITELCFTVEMLHSVYETGLPGALFPILLYRVHQCVFLHDLYAAQMLLLNVGGDVTKKGEKSLRSAVIEFKNMGPQSDYSSCLERFETLILEALEPSTAATGLSGSNALLRSDHWKPLKSYGLPKF